VIEIDAASLEPVVAQPYLPSNVQAVSKLPPVKVDQVVIGSCTNGRMDDFRAAAAVIDGRQVHPEVRLIVIPATQVILTQLIREGLAEKFTVAGATLSPPTCGPCIGGHMGVLAAGETGLYTTNRNFHGRNGHPDSMVFLSGPEVAAASAITGIITDPRTI
jgi:3-isopropylmalate/(R)-2-methylmalate dehydratase large subunit